MAIKITDCTISCGNPDEYGVYDINNFSVEYNEKKLEFGKDYLNKNMPVSIVKDNNIITSITILGIDNYEGEATVEYKVGQIALDINDYNFSIEAQIYTGYKIIPDIKTELMINRDFRISDSDENINIGEGYLIIKGIGKFIGEMIIEFNINPLRISNCEVVVPEIIDESFDRSKVEVKKDRYTLIENKDYEIEFRTEIIQNAKVCYICITGINNCTGYIEEMVHLNDKFADINKENIELSGLYFPYSGEEIIPGIISKDVQEGKDYTVEVANNIDAGKGTVTLRGAGAYEHSVLTKGFTITAIDISGADITCGEPTPYLDEDGNIKCEVYNIDNLKVKYNDTVLIRDTDYSITISPRNDMTEMIQYYDITINGKGNYTGTKSQSFITDVIENVVPIPQNPQYPEQLIAGLAVKLENAATYSQFSSRKYNALISGIVYIFSSNIRNNRIRITHSLNNVGINGCDGGWVSLDDILVKPYSYDIGERVIVNGTIYQYPNGTGNNIEKNNAMMYIVGLEDGTKYQYTYGVASSTNSIVQGWCSENELSKP